MKSPCSNRMTLEDLTKSEVHLILGVREGHGFGSLNCPLVVVAGLDGHRLETDIIPPSSDPLFTIELVWEADVKNIRRLRQANTPVKIECFSIVNSQKRDRIGYILLNLKQAQIIPHGKKVNIIESWHRLLGVRSEMKALNPEMLLTLRIEDSPDPTPKPIKVNPLNDVKRQNLLSTNALTPLLFADEDVIQIGSQDFCNDLFKLKIHIGLSSNIKLLIPNIKSYCRQLHVSDVIDNLVISYSILGYSMHSLINTAEINNRDSSIKCKDEPIVKVRSNLKTLRLYFNEFPLVVFRLLANDVEFASTSLQLKGLIVTDSLLQFQKDKGRSIETRCYLTPAPKVELGSIKPYTDVSICLSYSLHEGDDIPGVLKTVNKYQNHEDNSTPENSAVLETILSPRKRLPQTIINNSPALFDNDGRECNPTPIGDFDREIAPSHKNLSLPNSPKFFSSGANYQGSCTYRCNSDFDAVSPHSFILFVTLSSINFKKLPQDGMFTFSMHHPAAEIVCSVHGKMLVEQINEDICLPSIEVQFRFIARPDEINSVLMAEQPIISVCDSYNRVFASAIIETGILLSSQKSKECIFTASLESDSQSSSQNKKKKQQIGLLNILMELKDCGMLIKPASNQGAVHENFLSMDKTVAYRVVEELEDWKERQQELFKNELKRKECQHLTMLSSEWTKRRIELEDNLNRNVEQCRNLAQSLNEATDNMRERSRKNSEKERALALAEKELERKYELKFQELKEATNRMEADVNHKLSLMKFEKTELLERIGQIEREKKRLLDNFQSLETELDSVRASGLSKEQAAGLLQEMKAIEEKLEAALESKMFFKEQWGKAVREIHRLKKEHQLSIQTQLQREHEELRKLQLGQQAKEEEKQMIHDKNILQDLKVEMQELSMHQQKQKQHGRTHEQLNQSAVHTSDFHSTPPIRDVNNAQLQCLINQRDQLLNSGSTTNREMLAALNNQIRTLLFQMPT